MIRVLPLLCLVGLGAPSVAQDELIAYVPKRHVERTADAITIGLVSTGEHGIYRLILPEGTLLVDVLNARGDLMDRQPSITNGMIDIRALRASTYTIRAHTSSGIAIRRFALMGRGASLWAIDAEPVSGASSGVK